MKNTHKALRNIAAFTGLLAASSLFAADPLYFEDFSNPTVRIDFPYLGGTGANPYVLGEWVASQGQSETGVLWGSTIENGEATVNTWSNNWQRAIAIVLDMSVYGAGEYTVSFDLVGEPGGIFSIAEIENLGSVMINTGKLSSEVFFSPEDSTAVVTNLLNPSDTGWLAIESNTSDGTATFNFSYDGTGYIGFAMSAYANSFTFDNFSVAEFEAPTTWGGFDIVGSGDVDTGGFLGWINVTFAPYVWNYSIEGWLFMDEPPADAIGSWMYIFD
jgi:hypothetical protein